ncbi:MAG: TonB-dependent receptor, partial [Haliscomenobacter sp.]
NTGIEGTLERSFADGYYYMLTTSLFKSIYRAGDRKWRNTVFNNSFAYNMLFGKEFALGRQKQHFLVLNLRYMVRGGNRYTPINIGESIRLNTTVYINYLAYVPRLPTYKRLDVGVSYKINRPHATWRFSADIQNISNRKNPVEQRYSTQTKALYYNYALPLVPIIGIKVDF